MLPSPYQEKFSPVIKGEDEPLPECDPEKTLKAKIVVPRGRLKEILYGEKESLFGFKPARLQPVRFSALGAFNILTCDLSVKLSGIIS